MPTENPTEPYEPGPDAPDYELDDYVTAETPDQIKALGDATRTTILAMLLDRAATTTHLAAALGKPKGTVGYHLNVLESAGLIRVVRTAKVRAMTEKYYGRVGRTILYQGVPGGSKLFMLQQAMDEAVIEEGAPLPMFTLRHVRVSQEHAVEFAAQVIELSEEFLSLPRAGATVWGFVAGVFPTDQPVLGAEEDNE
jgi:DNA-binding transcriptional ArsR family regulator